MGLLQEQHVAKARLVDAAPADVLLVHSVRVFEKKTLAPRCGGVQWAVQRREPARLRYYRTGLVQEELLDRLTLRALLSWLASEKHLLHRLESGTICIGKRLRTSPDSPRDRRCGQGWIRLADSSGERGE